VNNTIEIKTQAPLKAIGRRHELTFDDFAAIPELTGKTLPGLLECLTTLGVRPSGPNIFEYRFRDSPHGPRRIRNGRFTLTIAVPVAAVLATAAPFEFITLAAFKYVELLTNAFDDEWRRIRDLAEQSGFERSLVEREVYHSWKGVGHPETKVALQVGVK
jgi:predicted transcriptional regulator YdeE